MPTDRDPTPGGNAAGLEWQEPVPTGHISATSRANRGDAEPVAPAVPHDLSAPEPGSAAAYEAEERRQEAFDIAWRFLAHRDRTEAEVRANFTRKRVDAALVEEVVAALLEGGYVDDAAFALRFAEDRRNLDGWGAERIERRLNELGVDRAEIRRALEEAGDGGHDELAAACDLLARRFPHPPETPRDRDRALGFLVRKGYDLELAHDALRKHANATIEG